MFDDQNPKNPGSVPGDLPIGEPEDMLSDVDPSAPLEDRVSPAITPETTPQQPSALRAGILRPVERPEENLGINQAPREVNGEMNREMNREVNGVPPQGASQEIYSIKEPTLTRGLVTVFIVGIAITILGFGSWWIYNSFIKTDNSNDFVTTPVDFVIPGEEESQPIFVEEDSEIIIPDDVTTGNEELSQDIIDDQILFGEPVDKDGDGLDDQREGDIGTDPNNWDSDGDELSDGDEVIIWKTDPLNPDSDGDSYLDGAEIDAGFNPAGPGKLFEIPQEEEEVLNTSGVEII